jgi:uncharacterized repeat protein (TIGR03803 family)
VTVAPVTLAYTETVLYTFCSAANCTDGSAPVGGLIQDAHGNLYGTTQLGGGANNAGTVFRVDNTGQETVLYSFCSAANCTDGGGQEAGLIQDAAGNLYGTTTEGGAHGIFPPNGQFDLNGQFDRGGIMFRVDNAGHETVLHSFCGDANCTDGEFPYAGLTQDADGNLYGTTVWEVVPIMRAQCSG